MFYLHCHLFIEQAGCTDGKFASLEQQECSSEHGNWQEIWIKRQSYDMFNLDMRACKHAVHKPGVPVTSRMIALARMPPYLF